MTYPTSEKNLLQLSITAQDIRTHLPKLLFTGTLEERPQVVPLHAFLTQADDGELQTIADRLNGNTASREDIKLAFQDDPEGFTDEELFS